MSKHSRYDAYLALTGGSRPYRYEEQRYTPSYITTYITHAKDLSTTEISARGS